MNEKGKNEEKYFTGVPSVARTSVHWDAKLFTADGMHHLIASIFHRLGLGARLETHLETAEKTIPCR